MSENLKQEVTAEQQPEKKKNFLAKIKESVDDREEQLELVSTFVRLGILVWSGSILTLAYIKLPPAFGIPEQKLDPTFIASVRVCCLDMQLRFHVHPSPSDQWQRGH